jgi:hypothetical protein
MLKCGIFIRFTGEYLRKNKEVFVADILKRNFVFSIHSFSWSNSLDGCFTKV